MTVAKFQPNTFPTSVAEVTQPVAGAIMHKEYVKTVGRMAYVWGWPLVNSFNRRAGITQAPAPGRLGGVVPVAPRGRLCMLNDYVLPKQSFVACPNQDVAYGVAFCSLDEEPIVIQVPDFGDRFWVYALYDARTDQFGEMGKAYGTKPGFYLLVGPNWDGEVPDGITAVIRSSTEFGFVGPRIFLNDTDEDRAAIKLLVNQINGYPLTEFDGQVKIKDWDDVPDFPTPEVEGENKWVMPEPFFDHPGTPRLDRFLREDARQLRHVLHDVETPAPQPRQSFEFGRVGTVAHRNDRGRDAVVQCASHLLAGAAECLRIGAIGEEQEVLELRRFGVERLVGGLHGDVDQDAATARLRSADDARNHRGVFDRNDGLRPPHRRVDVHYADPITRREQHRGAGGGFVGQLEFGDARRRLRHHRTALVDGDHHGEREPVAPLAQVEPRRQCFLDGRV